MTRSARLSCEALIRYCSLGLLLIPFANSFQGETNPLVAARRERFFFNFPSFSLPKFPWFPLPGIFRPTTPATVAITSSTTNSPPIPVVACPTTGASAGECTCGTFSCSSGQFCSTLLSACIILQACPTTAAIIPCTCGSTMCLASQTCAAATSTCTNPTCATGTGSSSLTTGSCTCGSTTPSICKVGEYCTLAGTGASGTCRAATNCLPTLLPVTIPCICSSRTCAIGQTCNTDNTCT